MTLSKKEKAEVLKVYDAWLDSYLNGDVETYDSYLDDHYHFIGSTDNEDFLNREDTTNFFRQTADQLAGKTRIRNKLRIIEKFDQLIFITELFDADFLHGDEWAYYGKFRFTSALQKKKEGWRFIYQHFSMPDSKAQKGETLGIEQITAENLRLREAVKRRTKELEHKNRELEIEAAKERVRARTMAMHKSSELSEVVQVVYAQLEDLGICDEESRLTIGVIDEDTGIDSHWSTQVGGGIIDRKYNLPLKNYPYPGKNLFEKWLLTPRANRKEQLDITEYKGDALQKMVQYVLENSEYAEDPHASQLQNEMTKESAFFVHEAWFSHGNLILTRPDRLDQNDAEVLKRFAGVFEQSYIRYLDLQKAESQAREAQIDLAVERVRAKALSMYKSEEILQVAHKIKEEILGLGIPGIAAATILLKETNAMYRMWDLTSMEKKGEKMNLPLDIRFNMENTHPDFYLRKVWNKGDSYKVIIQDLKSLQITTNWLRENMKEKEADEADQFIKGTGVQQVYHPTISLNNGRMCIDLVEEPSDEIESILTKMGAAFDLAYKRFEDLQKAEDQARLIKTEKERLEATLEELKSTQAQLIQSEKMASLGELTAGIAHEIQNPLNFVNNFSELNEELLAELREEIEAKVKASSYAKASEDEKAKAKAEVREGKEPIGGDLPELFAILEDLMANEEKIKHHGKRAEGIVKAMLQHSRGSSGTKEPTDINALCDEYLRLAYHGMRARDKSFNAQFEADFDPKLPVINVDPQEMGRVILNLINNAFYAVSQKQQSSNDNYSPKVIVKTTLASPLRGDKGGGFVEIRVTDNGPGIPSHLKGKIFQPFFTTKPTGQGTGLGLSLAYDIVKAHGGELKVETDDGIGSEFVIRLPVSNI